MDKDAEIRQLEGERSQIEQYLAHPISRQILEDNGEQQDALMDTLLNIPIIDLESFFKHFEAVGHLRGLRRAKDIVLDTLEDVKDKIKELEKQ